jgi:hypothetical protein
MYNLNYALGNLGVQSWRRIISEGRQKKKKVEYDYSRLVQEWYIFTKQTFTLLQGLESVSLTNSFSVSFDVFVLHQLAPFNLLLT